MKLHRFLLTVLPVLGFAGPSRADVFFNNLLQGVDGSAGFNAVDQRHASDFLTGGTPSTITSITALLANSSSILPLSATFSIFTDVGGSPGALVGLFDTPALVPPDGVGPFTAASPGINLQANTPYWLVGKLNNEDIGGTLTWQFDTGEGTDGGSFSTMPSTPFMSTGNNGLIFLPSETGNFMFSVEGLPNPEPSTLTLLVTAGTVVAFGRWRRRQVALDILPDRGPAS